MLIHKTLSKFPMLVDDSQRKSLQHGLILAQEALAGRSDTAHRESLFVSIQVLAHILATFDAKDIDLIDDVNAELLSHHLRLQRLTQ